VYRIACGKEGEEEEEGKKSLAAITVDDMNSSKTQGNVDIT